MTRLFLLGRTHTFFSDPSFFDMKSKTTTAATALPRRISRQQRRRQRRLDADAWTRKCAGRQDYRLRLWLWQQQRQQRRLDAHAWVRMCAGISPRTRKESVASSTKDRQIESKASLKAVPSLIPLLGEQGSVQLAQAMLSDVLLTIDKCVRACKEQGYDTPFIISHSDSITFFTTAGI